MDYILAHIRHWLETEELYRSLALLFFGSVITFIGTYLASLRKGYSFLSRCLHAGEPTARFKAIPMLYSALKANQFFPGILQSARLLAEIQILSPAEPKRVIYDYDDKAQYQTAVAKWKKDLAKRSVTQKAQLEVLLDEAKRQAGKGPPRRKKAEEEAINPEIKISVGQIDASRAGIRRYFQIAAEMKLHQADTFLSTIKIIEGFIAPTFLIAGIMTRYKQDWELIISNYRRQLEDVKPPYSHDLVELRSFQFNCWLLWGPSIPLCRCDQWTLTTQNNPHSKHVLRTKSHRGHVELSYQYGFGDESNSVDLVVSNGTSQEWRDTMRERLTPSRDEASGPGAKHVVSAPMHVSARLRWGPGIEEDRICLAQKAVLGGSEAHRSSHRGRVVLEFLSEKEGDTVSSRYYSAYIWAMFIMLDVQTGAPFSASEESGMTRWQDLFPLFEHGNIADATTYLTLKKALAAKICAVLGQFLANPKNARVAVAFACSFDESHCTASVLYPTPAGESIRDLIVLEAGHSPALGGVRDRLFLQPDKTSATFVSYSSCHLPHRVEEFYADLESQANSAIPEQSHDAQ